MDLWKNKTALFLSIIFVLAVTVRVIAAQHSNVITDESVFAVRAINFLSSGMYSTIDQAPLHLALVDLSEQIFGVHGWSSRLPNILFGALAVLVIYLIVREFGDRRWALLSAALFAFSPYSILFNIEPDMTAIFFVLLSVLFFIKALHKNQNYFLYSFFFLGIAALAKLIALFILPAYLIGLLYYHWNKDSNPLLRLEQGKLQFKRQGLKTLFWSILLLLIAFSPILIYNILLYIHTGLPDLIFARSLGFTGYDKFFGNDLRSWSFGSNLNAMWIFVQRLWNFDAVILFSSLLGIVYSFIKKKKENIIMLIAFVCILFFISGTAGTSKSHYLFLTPFLAIVGAYALAEMTKKVKSGTIVVSLVTLTLIFSSAILVHNKILEPEGMVELREEAQKMENNALVIVDSRIYRGNIAWNFHDKHYVESQYFPQVHQLLNDQNLSKVTAPVYFVECILDDCGWGRGIKENKEVQDLNEGLVALFNEGAIEVTEIPGKQYSFKIYKTMMMVPPDVYIAIEGTHQFMFYSVGWQDLAQNIDHYTIASSPLLMLNYLGKILFYLALLVSFCSVFLISKLLYRELKAEDKTLIP